MRVALLDLLGVAMRGQAGRGVTCAGLFGALVLVQAAHSAEEYVGRLWVSFPPARVVVGLVSSDPERGFLLINGGVVALGVWCYCWPIRRHWAAATPICWLWIIVETINGIGHPLWSLRQRGYTPGLATAPLLLLLALALAWRSRDRARG